MPPKVIRAIRKRWLTTTRILRGDGVWAVCLEGVTWAATPWRRWREARQWQRIKRSCTNGQFVFDVAGHQMALNPDDPGISKELAIYGSHEPQATKMAMELLSEGMVVIDIGANLGYYALQEARAVGASGKVLAIEPAPENFQLLEANVRSNGYTHVTLIQAAIGDRRGTAYLRLATKSNWHSLANAPGYSGRDVEVPLYSLDDLADEHGLDTIDLVRMDIEGYETVAFNGMTRVLARDRPYLLMELHPHLAGPEAIGRLLDRFHELGYRPRCVIDQNRDVPWHPYKVRREVFDMAELKRDARLGAENRALTVLLGAR